MKRKIYEPVREFERQTSYCPLYLAWRILPSSPRLRRGRRLHRGARDYFRTPIPEAFADQLAHRAEAVFARHPFWARKATPRAGSQQQFQCWRQREFILKVMRHWLAGVLAKECPALFRDLPESFKVGQALPSTVLRTPSPIRWAKGLPTGLGFRQAGSRGRSPHDPASRFVHGCELLAD